MRTSNLVSASALLTAGLLLTGCSVGSSAETTNVQAEQAIPAQLADDQTAAIQEVFNGLDYDYDPASTTAKLAGWSELVVSGTVKQIQEGRVAGLSTDQIADVHTIVIVIEVDSVATGSADAKSEGLVYVEVPSPGSRPASDYVKAIPVGTPIVAYLLPAPAGTDDTNPFQNPTAGRPDGVKLYMPANPQSLVVELKGGGVSLLLDSDARAGKLADALPGGSLILGVK